MCVWICCAQQCNHCEPLRVCVVDYVFLFVSCRIYFYVLLILFPCIRFFLVALSVALPLLQLIAHIWPCVYIRNVLSFALVMAHNGEMFICLLCVWAAFGLYVLARDKCIHDFVDVDLVRLFNYETFFHCIFRCLILYVPSIHIFRGKNLFVNFPNKFLLYTQFLLIYNVCIKNCFERWTHLRMWYVWNCDANECEQFRL